MLNVFAPQDFNITTQFLDQSSYYLPKIELDDNYLLFIHKQTLQYPTATTSATLRQFEAYQFIGKDLIKIVSNESNMTSGLNYDIKIDYRQSGGRLSLIHYYYSDL